MMVKHFLYGTILLDCLELSKIPTSSSLIKTENKQAIIESMQAEY